MIHDGIAPRGRQALLATLGLLLVPFLAHEAPAAPRMSTTPSWIVPGDQSNALFGENAITAGDVDGDGFSDILVGARTYANGEASEGRMMIFRGGPSGVSSTPFRTYESDEVGAQYGASVACLGDATGDGFDDVAVGAPAYGASDIGAVFVYKGSASGPPAGGANRTLLGDGIDNGGFGGWVSDAGDVNGDGFQDLLVGSSLYSNGQANEGRALLYLGAAGGVSTSASWIVESNVVGARFGYRVSTAGDVNGDGFDDVLIGAVRFTNGQTTEGKAFLYLGSAAGLSTTPAWQVEGEQTGANLGASLANAGDVNADGYADFLIGAQAYDNGNTNEGRVYLFLGSPTPISTTPARTYEGNEDAALLGTALGTAGDVNGDGYADYLIGGSGFDAGGTNRGKAMLFLGGGGTPPASPAFTYLGPQDGDSFADCAVTAGDIDADGYSDFLIGASHYDGAINEGARSSASKAPRQSPRRTRPGVRSGSTPAISSGTGS
ncbi:MAG: FG-GAP-like repeat-containing protein [Candidatus Eisenbacteria bacterium]